MKRRIYEFEQKASEEEAIAKLEDAREKRKLDAARRINEAEEIGGSVAQEIKEDRRVNIADLKFEKPSISNAEFKLLTFAKKVSDGRFLFRDGLVFAGDPESYDTETFSFGETHRDTLLLSEAIAHLESGDYLLEKKSAYSNSIEYEVTMAGYKLLDAP